MGAGDRRFPRSVRQVRRSKPTILSDGPPACGDASSLETRISSLPSPDWLREKLEVQVSQIARLPTPLRRPPRSLPSSKGARAGLSAPPAAGSYREKLRANGQRALELSQEAELRTGPPPPPTAPPTLDAILSSGDESLPPPPLMCATGEAEQWSAGELVPSPQPCYTLAASGQLVPIMIVPMSQQSVAGGTMDGLMARQQIGSSEIDCEQIVAQLYAALPACYED